MSLKHKLTSIFRQKCPKCHKGDFFVGPTLKMKTMTQIHDKCPACEENYTPEPGFYYGAMYTSYAISVALGVAGFIATWVIVPDASAELLLAVVIATIFLPFPRAFRWSRLIWINIFVHYDETVAKEVAKKNL